MGVKPKGPHILMLVDYQHSPVGPYQELLLIPGYFRLNDVAGFSISHIHVSTEISTQNGRKHWGIPKETSNFSWNNTSHQESCEITAKNHRSCQLAFEAKGPSIPIATSWLPYQLFQKMDEQTFKLKPLANGQIKYARMASFQSNMPGFEVLNDCRPLFAVHARSFGMKFPIASIDSGQ